MNGVDIERVAAQLDIRNLLALLAQYADDGTVDDYLALFTDDATWETHESPLGRFPATRLAGHDEIAESVRQRRAAGIQGPGSNTRHLLLTMSVQVEGH